MKKKYRITPLEDLQEVSLFVIHGENEKCSDFEFFLRHFSHTHPEEVSKIVKWISKIGENGALERYFRINEGKISDNVVAIPIEKLKLRLYCIRWDEKNLLIGGGGLKQTAKYQDDPVLYQHVKILQQIDKKLKDRFKKGALRVVDGIIQGLERLSFDVNIDD